MVKNLKQNGAGTIEGDPEEILQRRLIDLNYVISKIKNDLPCNSTVDAAMLGCISPHFAYATRRILQKLIMKPVRLWIYQRDEQMQSLAGVIQHDYLRSMPDQRFDYILSFQILKTYPSTQQWAMIYNSYHSLVPGGCAIHMVHEMAIGVAPGKDKLGYYKVPVDQWISGLWSSGIPCNIYTMPKKQKNDPGNLALVIRR